MKVVKLSKNKVYNGITLCLIEDIVINEVKFSKFGPFSNLEYYNIPGYEVDFVSKLEGLYRLPDEALEALINTINEIK